MVNPERNPMTARSGRERDAVLLERRVAEHRRARQRGDVEASREEVHG